MAGRKKPPGIVVRPSAASMTVGTFPPTVWKSDNYAEDWFQDALSESRSGKGIDSLRREIIFATCFSEAYIFEWTRRTVQIDEINNYFPPKRRSSGDPRYRRKIIDKWKQIPGELYDDGKLNKKPKLDLSRLRELLKYRHGLIHAAGSRPATDNQPKEAKPFPTKADLKKLSHGWAVSIVFDLVSELHRQLSESCPPYLTAP